MVDMTEGKRNNMVRREEGVTRIGFSARSYIQQLEDPWGRYRQPNLKEEASEFGCGMPKKKGM
jgi:hypothetical protein